MHTPVLPLLPSLHTRHNAMADVRTPTQCTSNEGAKVGYPSLHHLVHTPHPLSYLFFSLVKPITTTTTTLATPVLANGYLDALARETLAQRRALLDTRKLLGAPNGKDLAKRRSEHGRRASVEAAVGHAHVDEGEPEAEIMVSYLIS